MIIISRLYIVCFLCSIYAALLYGLYPNYVPDEDAFILFKYVKNLVAGHGIAYYPGGPAAEGASDFLWLGCLSVLHYFGWSPFAASQILSLLSLVAIGLLLGHFLLTWNSNGFIKFSLLSLFLLTVSLSNQVNAALAGFSTVFYGFIFVLITAALLVANTKHFLYIPWLSLILGLVRPDGVLPGVAATVIAFFLIVDIPKRKSFITNTFICFIIGCVYFVWRWKYFGHLLPLPLYVKSHGNLPVLPMAFYETLPSYLTDFLQRLKGMGVQKIWLEIVPGVSPLGLIVSIFVVLILKKDRKLFISTLLAGIPAFILFVELCFAVQLQNTFWRFQSPIIACLVLLLVYSVTRLEQRLIQVFGLLVSFLVCVPLIQDGLYGYKYLASPTWNTYTYELGQKLPSILPAGSSVAVTEAGIFPYWLENHTVYDLVGLNSAEFSDTILTVETLSDLQPDLFMVNQANTLSVRDCIGCEELSPRVKKLPNEALTNLLHGPAYKALKAAPDVSYESLDVSNVYVAAIRSFQFLAASTQYSVYMVDNYGRGDFEHIYAVKKQTAWNQSFIESVLKATS